jgi:hypothetical protein
MSDPWASGVMRFEVAQADPFERLPALAARLGVKPYEAEDRGQAEVLLHTKNGERYSLFDLINAFLDRLDKA